MVSWIGEVLDVVVDFGTANVDVMLVEYSLNVEVVACKELSPMTITRCVTIIE